MVELSEELQLLQETEFRPQRWFLLWAMNDSPALGAGGDQNNNNNKICFSLYSKQVSKQASK
jgi:hypothetical protein